MSWIGFLEIEASIRMDLTLYCKRSYSILTLPINSTTMIDTHAFYEHVISLTMLHIEA